MNLNGLLVGERFSEEVVQPLASKLHCELVGFLIQSLGLLIGAKVVHVEKDNIYVVCVFFFCVCVLGGMVKKRILTLVSSTILLVSTSA